MRGLGIPALTCDSLRGDVHRAAVTQTLVLETRRGHVRGRVVTWVTFTDATVFPGLIGHHGIAPGSFTTIRVTAIVVIKSFIRVLFRKIVVFMWLHGVPSLTLLPTLCVVHGSPVVLSIASHTLHFRALRETT